MLEDDLFVRAASGHAANGARPGDGATDTGSLAVPRGDGQPPIFDPSASSKQFTLPANDFTTMILASPLLKILSREAPSIDLNIKPVTRIDLAEQIDLGRIDLAIGIFSAPPNRFRTALRFE
jgi:hypothetical protein